MRKWVFSLEHKGIGLQYYFLGLAAVFVGMFLSLLMRIHLIWPTAVLPLVGDIKPEPYLTLVTMHGTIMVFFVLTTAPQGGFGNYFLPIQIGAADMAFPVLNMLSLGDGFGLHRHARGFLRDRRCAAARLDRVSTVERGADSGAGRRSRRGHVGDQHRALLQWRVDKRAELHHHHVGHES